MRNVKKPEKRRQSKYQSIDDSQKENMDQLNKIMGITQAHEHLMPPIQSTDDLDYISGSLDGLDSTEADKKRERIRARMNVQSELDYVL